MSLVEKELARANSLILIVPIGPYRPLSAPYPNVRASESGRAGTATR
jgi:hypothetical protein